MVKVSIAVLALVLSVSAMAADEYRLNPDSRLQVSSDQRSLYDVLQGTFLKSHPDVIAQKFTTQSPAPDDPGGVCQKASRSPVETYLEFRDTEGVLHSVKHIVCVGDGASQSFVLGVVPGSEKTITEIGFKKDMWVYSENQRGVNDDGGVCDVNKTVVQPVCVPAPYIVYDAQIDRRVDKSERSVLRKLEADQAHKNCVLVTFDLASPGFNTIPGTNIRTPDCKGGSWFKYSITLKGYLAGANQ
jgi:hypothetical protein